MNNIDYKLYSLSKSKFRSSFYLNKKMKEYEKEKDLEKIKKDSYEIIEKRLKPSIINNDGKQTPMKQVHPVFIAQHATATCCRGCLSKWHNIEKGKELTEEELDYIVQLIMKWIIKEYESNNN